MTADNQQGSRQRRDITRAPKVEQQLLQKMLEEKGFDVGLQTAEVYYDNRNNRNKRHLMISEDFYMPPNVIKAFVEEYERRVSVLN